MKLIDQHKKYIGTILCVLALGGCAVGPKYTPLHTETPDNWQSWHGGDQTLANPQWRQSSETLALRFADGFQDPVLHELLTQLNAQNFDLQTATLRWAQARAQTGSAQAQTGPNVNLNGGVNRQAVSENGPNTRTIDAMGLSGAAKDKVLKILGEPFTAYQGGLDVGWEIDLWGRVRHSIEAANANERAAQALLSQVQISLQAELMRQYIELRALQQQLAVLNQQLDAAKTSQHLLAAKFNGGLLDAREPTQAQTVVDELQQQHSQLLARQTALMNQITLMVGGLPGSMNEALLQPKVQLLNHTLPSLQLGLPSQLTQRRPDIIQAQAQFQMAVANTGVAVADLYPRVQLGANAGWSSLNAGTFFDVTSFQWSIGPSISLPIFDMGRRRSIVTLRELQQQEAAVNYQKTVLAAWHEVDSLLSQYQSDAQQVKDLTDKSKQAAKLYHIAQAQFRGGLIDELPVLDAQRNWLQIDNQRIDAIRRQWSDGVLLYKALGGNDWQNL